MTSTEVRERIAEAYRRGEDSPTIARREGLTPSYVCTLAQQAGCEIRGRCKSYTDDEILAVLERFHAEGLWTRDEYNAWRTTHDGWTPSIATMRNRNLWQSRRPPRVPALESFPVETPRGRTQRLYATARWLYANGMSMAELGRGLGLDPAVVTKAIRGPRRPYPQYKTNEARMVPVRGAMKGKISPQTRFPVRTETCVNATGVTIRLRQGLKVKTVSVTHELAQHLRAALNTYYDNDTRPEEQR